MRRFKSRSVYAASVLVILGIVFAIVYRLLAMPRIMPHAGDGKFANISWRYPWVTIGLPVPGYTIDFEHFTLSKDHEATYQIEKLPALQNEVGIYLCVNDPAHRWRSDSSRKTLNAKVEIEVTDDSGRVVTRVDKQFSKLTWAEPEGGADTYGLYEIPNSFFRSQSQQKYRIQIRYSSDPAFEDLEGFVFIRCGGSI